MAFIKMRKEKDAYQIAYAARLDTSETISTAVVTVEYATVDVWTIVTATFISSAMSVIEVGKTVQFTMEAATGVQQPEGRYRVRCVAATTAGRFLETDVDLLVND